MAKDVIYLEVDDEITTVIDKLQDSPQDVVALVLPKRATVFQSTVNMKLLKKTAQKAKKSVVLITSDATVLGIAATTKIHVAKTLQSKPDVPKVPAAAAAAVAAAAIELHDEKGKDVEEPEEPDESKDEPEAEHEPTIELDNTDKTEKPKGPEGKKDRKLKVPNFDRFRLRFFLIGAGILALLLGWFFAYVIMPRAIITVKTNSSQVAASVTFTAKTDQAEFDKTAAMLPAKAVEVTLEDSEVVPATGEKNNGAKATGKVVIFNCSKDDKLSDTNRTVPAGTTVSSGGFSFVTAKDVSVQPSSFTGNNCQYNKPSAEVGITSVEGGKKYNLSPRTYAVSGFPSMTARDDNGTSGGTDAIIKVVSDKDIETAKNKMVGRKKEEASTQLSTQLTEQGLMPLTATIDEQAPALTADPAVGKEADQTTVKAVTKFTMLGVSQANLDELLNEAVKTQMTDQTQNIQNNGLATGAYSVVEKKSPTDQKLSLQTTATIGPNIDTNAIAEQAAGRKTSEVKSEIMDITGVEDVTVSYKPFWVFQMPKAARKINVVVEQPSQ